MRGRSSVLAASESESCKISHNYQIDHNHHRRRLRQCERLGSGPILSLACPFFSPKVFIVHTLPVTETSTGQNPLSKGSNDLISAYRRVRELSESLCQTLQPEDCVVQTVPEVSPTKWHLAHTSWFFETFVVKEAVSGHTLINPED